MSQTRIAFWKGDWSAVRTNLKVAKEMNEKGGDWDRRNRLKVYEGAYLITQRDFKGASTLLLDSIATFTATELLSYDRFVFYTVISCIKCLDRPTLKTVLADPVMGRKKVRFQELAMKNEVDPLNMSVEEVGEMTELALELNPL